LSKYATIFNVHRNYINSSETNEDGDFSNNFLGVSGAMAWKLQH
jgi:hypothetical protein